jgi:tRNA A22 N-methylase
MTPRLTVAEVAAKLDTHEQVCAQRYGSIADRLGKIESVATKAATVLICGMGGILVKLVFFA